MSVDRGQRLKNMFAPPKTADLVTGDPAAAPEETPLKEEKIIEIPVEAIEEKSDDTIQLEDPITKNEVVADPPLIEVLPEPAIKQKKAKKVADKPTPPDNDVTNKAKAVAASKFDGPKVHIGCRVSNEMKNALEDIAKDFAYLARKEYGIKIKDDASSIQRAFLILGMNCFTETVRRKILQEYDNESLMQDEVSQQLLALMRIHKVEIDDIDF